MPLMDFLEQAVSVFGAAPNDAHKRVWEEIGPWLKNLTLQAGKKWLPRLAAGISCELNRNGAKCHRSAIAACDVCERPCCLDHSRIDQLGDAICYACIVTAIRVAQAERMTNGQMPRQTPWSAGAAAGARQAPPPQPPPGPTRQEIAAAWKVLKLKPGSSWSEVEAEYKKLLVKLHPDRQPPDKRAAAEEKFKRVRVAYDLLKKVHPEAL